MYSAGYSCQISMKSGKFLDKLKKKFSNSTVYEVPSSGSRVFPYGQTDRNDEANNRFSHSCDLAKKKKNYPTT